MTVKELIEKLQQFQPDMNVVVENPKSQTHLMMVREKQIGGIETFDIRSMKQKTLWNGLSMNRPTRPPENMETEICVVITS